jgi:hypothetical protein
MGQLHIYAFNLMYRGPTEASPKVSPAARSATSATVLLGDDEPPSRDVYSFTQCST